MKRIILSLFSIAFGLSASAVTWYESTAVGRYLQVMPDGIHAACPAGDGVCKALYRFENGFLTGVFVTDNITQVEVENPCPGCPLDDVDDMLMGILNSDGSLPIIP